MNLLLYFACSIFGLKAFVLTTIIFMSIEIIWSFVAVPLLGSWTGVIWGIAKIIALIVFFCLGFPINAVLIFFLVLYIICSAFVFVDPVGGIINIVTCVLNIVGFILFRINLL